MYQWFSNSTAQNLPQRGSSCSWNDTFQDYCNKIKRKLMSINKKVLKLYCIHLVECGAAVKMILRSLILIGADWVTIHQLVKNSLTVTLLPAGEWNLPILAELGKVKRTSLVEWNVGIYIMCHFQTEDLRAKTWFFFKLSHLPTTPSSLTRQCSSIQMLLNQLNSQETVTLTKVTDDSQ